MKILQWGIYSPWIMNFTENFLLKNHYEIWMLNRGSKKEYKKYMDFYRKNGIHLIDVPQLVSDVFDGKEKGNYFKEWYSHVLLIKAVMKEGPFDLIHMQFVDYEALADVVLLKYLMKTRLVLSYWGSDLLREKEERLLSVQRLVRQADFLTFDNKDLEEEFIRIYQWADKKKLRTVRFGLPVLDMIDEKRNKAEDIRKKWGIPEAKRVVAVGYNGMPQQQHKKILGMIGKTDAEYKKKIILLLQMTYGGTREYRNSVVAAANRTGCEYMDIQRFLSDEEVAELRILTDIYINAQTTDAFSGSICENLYADTLLMNAKWLRYQELETYDFKYLEFKNFSEIKELLQTTVEKMQKISVNRELVWKLRSWACCQAGWKKVYRRACKSCRKRR